MPDILFPDLNSNLNHEPVRELNQPPSVVLDADFFSTAIRIGEGSLTPPTIGDTDSNRFVLDGNDIWRPVPAEAMRQKGSRVVWNRVAFSEDFSDATWAKLGTATVTGMNTLNLPAVADELRFELTETVFFADSYTARIELSGTGTVSLRIENGGAQPNEGTTVQITLTATPVIYTVKKTFFDMATHTAVRFNIFRDTADTATEVTLNRAQLQLKTNTLQPNTPDEYTSSGVLSSPFHNFGADGFKYLRTLNANTVTNDELTEIVGAPIVFTPPELIAFAGNDGTFVDTPNSAAINLIDGIDLRWFGNLTDWSSEFDSRAFASMWREIGNQRKWIWDGPNAGPGTLRFFISGQGITFESVESLPHGFADDSFHGIRVVWQKFPADRVVRFFVRDDDDIASDIGWTDITDPGEPAIDFPGLFDSSSPLEIGSRTEGIVQNIVGDVTKFIMKDDFNGTTVADLDVKRDATWENPGRITSSTTGEVYSLHDRADLRLLAGSAVKNPPVGLFCEGPVTELSGRSEDIGTWPNQTTAAVARSSITPSLKGGPFKNEVLTDASAVVTSRRQVNTVITSSTSTYYMSIFTPIALSPTVFPRFQIVLFGGSGVVQIDQVFNPITGTMASIVNDGSISIKRVGDFWHILYMLVDTGTGNNSANMVIDPAWNTDGTVTQDVAAQGDTEVALAALYKDNWSASPIFTRGGITKTRLGDTDYLLDVLNWSPEVDARGSMSFELEAEFDEPTGTAQGILTPAAATINRAISFHPTTDSQFVMDDGTSNTALTASVPVPIGQTRAFKLRWGGGTMRFSINGVLAASVAYDGSFNPLTDIVIFKDLTLGASMKNLKVWQADKKDGWLAS